MADPLSIAASVAGLITISAQILGMTKELFAKVKDAPASIMQVRQEVESMQSIFSSVQLLLSGTGSRLNHGCLTMISIHNLMVTLTGCVIVYSKLEKTLSEVCGFSDPVTASNAWQKAGLILDQVRWGLWKQEEVLCIIEDLQRQKLSLNVMLSIITCTTVVEASESQKILQEQTTQILQSNHVHSVLLRELISRQEEQARVLDELRSNTSTMCVGSATVSTVSSSASSAGSNPSVYNRDSDNASIMSRRSTFSFRLGRPAYLEDLKTSRAYKRLRHFGIGIDSSSDSVYSYDSACSTGNWSMLSDMTLGDLSVSQIAVLNLPIQLADVWNPEPFQNQSSSPAEAPGSRPKSRFKSSRGRIHNAIKNGNLFLVRTLLALGLDIEELDSTSRTPLIHALCEGQFAICELLLEKGASIDRVEVFARDTHSWEKPELGAFIEKAMQSRSTAVPRVLLILALGEAGDNQGSRKRMNSAIEMNQGHTIRAKSHLDPHALEDVEMKSGTPFVFAYYLRRNEMGEILFEKVTLDKATKDLKTMVLTDSFGGADAATRAALESVQLRMQGRLHAAIEECCPRLVELLIAMNANVEEIDAEGRTPLAYAGQVVLQSTFDKYESLEFICKALLEKATDSVTQLKNARKLVTTGYANVNDARIMNKEWKIQLQKAFVNAANDGHEMVVRLLLEMGADINHAEDGCTALKAAGRKENPPLVKILIEWGAMVRTGNPAGASILHYAVSKAKAESCIKLLLDSSPEIRKMINWKDRAGNTPLHYCGFYCKEDSAKVLVQAGADLTIKSYIGYTPYGSVLGRRNELMAKYLWTQLSPEQKAQEKPLPADW